MKTLNIIYITLILCLTSVNLNAKDIFVKSTTGSSSYKKFENAIKNANPGDVVIVNQDVTFDRTDKPIIIIKGITIRGANKSNGRYQLIRKEKKGSRNNSGILTIRSNNVKVENVDLIVFNGQAYKAVDLGLSSDRKKLYSNLQFINCNFIQENVNDTARGLFFEGSFKNVLIKGCKFNFWFSLVVRDSPTIDGFTITECEFSNGSHQISFDGALLDENDPTYGIGESLINHNNIVIEKSKFKITESFNIALAYTKNVTIKNNTQIDGGTNGYSQPIHIEDRCKNIVITENTMKSKQIGILVYSTDKVGHGQGRRFTEFEKRTKGSGNITITNNKIDANSDAVSAAYLNGFLTFKGNNVITSRKKALNVQQSYKNNSNTKITINDQSRMKGKLYSQIKQEPVKLKRDMYYTSDINPL